MPLNRNARRAAALAAMLLLAATGPIGCGSNNPTGNNLPPSVTITSPAPGAILSPVGFTIRANASDDDGVDRVEFFVDGGLVSSDASAPYEAYVFSLGLAPGVAHTIEAAAIDTDNARTARQTSIQVRQRVYRQLTAGEIGIEHEQPAWSPEGLRIAYTRGATEPGAAKSIYVISSTASPGFGQSVTSTLLQDQNPSFSPDGQWIAFESNRSGAMTQIFAAHVSSGKVVELTPNALGSSNERHPSWGPDDGGESWVVYDTDRTGGVLRDLYMVRVATEPDTIIVTEPFDQSVTPDVPTDTHASDDLAPSWSSEGRLVASSNRTGLYSVNLLDPFGSLSAAVILGTNSSLIENVNPAISPGDAFVAFTEDPTLVPKVFVVPSLGPGSIRFDVAPSTGTDAFPNASDPAWSPDGARIAFVSSRTGTAEIWILE